MEFSIKNVIFRRVIELFSTEAILSLIVTALNVAGLLTTQLELFVALLSGVLIFAAVNILQMRHCYFDLKNDFLYFSSNISAAILFAALQFLIYIFADSDVYTWIFAITKCARYLFLGLPIVISALIFHLISLATILISPIGMSWVFSIEDDELEDEYDVYDEEY